MHRAPCTRTVSRFVRVVMEHTIDQLAARAKMDPVEYRRALLTKAGATRHLVVLSRTLTPIACCA